MNPIVFALSALFGAGGSILGSLAQAKAQARLHKRNALILEQRAIRARKVRREEARQRRTEGTRLKAKQLVLFAKSGLAGAGTGTRKLVGDETSRRIEEQASIIQERGAFEAETLQSQARLERDRATSVRKAGRFAALGSLATGLGSAGMDFYTFRRSTPRTTKKGFTNPQAVFGAP